MQVLQLHVLIPVSDANSVFVSLLGAGGRWSGRRLTLRRHGRKESGPCGVSGGGGGDEEAKEGRGKGEMEQTGQRGDGGDGR